MTCLGPLIDNAAVNKDELRNWRIQTLKLTESLVQQIRADEIPQISGRLTKTIKAAFPHFLKQSAPKKVDEKLAQVCTQAVKCAIALRKSKSNYAWTQRGSPDQATGSDIRVAGPRLYTRSGIRKDQTYTIEFTVFGSVTKDVVVAGTGSTRQTTISQRLVVIK